MLSIVIADGDLPIATAQIEPHLDENGEDSGQFAPLVEFRVREYHLLPAYEILQPVFFRAGEAARLLGRRPTNFTDGEREDARAALKTAKEIAARLRIRDSDGNAVEGRVTLFSEMDFSGHRLHAIGIALAERYVRVSQSTQSDA